MRERSHLSPDLMLSIGKAWKSKRSLVSNLPQICIRFARSTDLHDWGKRKGPCQNECTHYWWVAEYCTSVDSCAKNTFAWKVWTEREGWLYLLGSRELYYELDLLHNGEQISNPQPNLFHYEVGTLEQGLIKRCLLLILVVCHYLWPATWVTGFLKLQGKENFTEVGSDNLQPKGEVGPKARYDVFFIFSHILKITKHCIRFLSYPFSKKLRVA